MRPWVNVHVEPVAAGEAAPTADMAREEGRCQGDIGGEETRGAGVEERAGRGYAIVKPRPPGVGEGSERDRLRISRGTIPS
jgi:hypothetical protein